MRRPERGGASVELALALPLFAVLVLMLAQVGVLVQRQLLVTGAAREAARTAVTRTDSEAVKVAHKVAPLDHMDVRITRRGELVTARLSAPAEFRVAGVRVLTVHASASVVMLDETGGAVNSPTTSG